MTGWLEEALSLIRRFEGLRLQAYPDPASGGDPWTIGYGATGPGIHRGVIWTLSQAEADLRRRVMDEFEPGIRTVVQVPLSDPQRVALISLAYNIGLPAFRASTLAKMLNARNYRGAADQFPRWNKARGQVRGYLVRRRAEERGIFLQGTPLAG